MLDTPHRRTEVNRPCSNLPLAIAALWLGCVTSGAAPNQDRLAPSSRVRDEPVAALNGKLHSVGADTMDVMTFGWIQLYRRIHPQVEVTMEARSSLTAAPALTNGLAHLAPIAREFLPSELEMFRKRHGYDPLLIRVAGGSFATNNRSHAVAVYVHRENPLRHLTLAQLDAVFSTTRRRGYPRDIAVWGDLGLGGEWTYRPITIYSMRRPNGIVNFFQLRVLQGGEFKSAIHERGNTSDKLALAAVVESIANDPGAIGFASFGHGEGGVRALALSEDGNTPAISGTPESVADHTYPLARWVYIAINKPPGLPVAPTVKEFLQLVLSSEGQKVVARDEAFLPLPAAVRQQELAKIE